MRSQTWESSTKRSNVILKTLRHESKDVPAWHNMGNAYEELGNYSEAIKCFTQAIKYDNEHYESFFGRGSCYDTLEQYKKALQDYNRALEICRDYPELWYAKADVEYNLGNTGNA